MADLRHQGVPEIRLVGDDLLLDEEVDERVEPFARQLVERCGIGRGQQRRQGAVVVLLKQTGRAAGRERVCQYVLISGVPVSIKKKANTDRQPQSHTYDY